MWGPFTDVPSGCSQIMGGGLSPLQCSYSTSSTETIGLGMPGGTGSGASTPPNAQAGEYYILLLTNYNGAAGYVTLEQTAGTGETDCSIIDPCNIDNFTANISACSNDLYSVTGTIEVSDAPSTGDLIVEDCNGNQTIVSSAPFSASSYNYTLSNLNADGNGCNVKVYFSDETTCSQTITYTAPICTPTPCNMDNFDILIHSCNGNNTFDITGTVEFSNPPTSGQLVIEDCNGNSDTYNAPFTSPQTFTIANIPADGANCNISASFSADPACTIDIDYVNVEDCSCNAQIGTFTVTTDGTQNNHDITLCEGQSFTFLANGDYTPPDDVANPSITYDPGIWWAVYTCPPTIGLTPAAGVDINTDPCLVSFVNAASITDINDMGFINSFPPGTFTDNTVYFVPITMYNITDGYYSATNTGTPCYQMGTPYVVQYLPGVTSTETSDCQTGTVSVNVAGGSPAINGTNFTGTNLTPTTASFSTGTVANNGTIVVSGLQDGDNYAFDIEDEFNCAVHITGTFQGLSESGFTYGNSQYCKDESNPTPTITGASGGVFTVSPSGLSINSSTGTINLASSTSGDYIITYESPGTPCNSMTYFNITINPVPTYTITKDDPTCGNNDGIITINGLDPSTAYQVSYDDPAGTTVGPTSLTTDASGAIVFSTLPQGSYSNFIIENAEGCSTTNAGPISLNDQGGPSVTAPNDVVICLGEDVTLTATNPDGAIITWDNSISDGVAFTPSAAGTVIYTVTATDVNNCTATDQVNVTVNGLPTILAGQDQSICNGTSVTLTGTGAGSGGTYTWDHSVTNGVAFTPTNTETYQVIGKDANGCENTDDVTITVNTVPTFTVNHVDPSCGNTDGSITLSGLNPSTAFDVNYDLNGTSTGLQNYTSDASGNILIDNLGQGNYSNFEVSTAAGCSSTITTPEQLVEPNAPSVTAPSDVNICIGESVTLTATNPDGATISWDNGINDGVPFTPSTVGTTTYTVTATINNCSSSDQVMVNVHDFPTVVAGADQSICQGKSAIINATGATTYSWDNGLGTGASHTVIPTSTTTYEVTGTNAYGCENTDQVVITVNENPVPNFEGDNRIGCEPLFVNFTDLTGITGGTCHWDFGDGNTSNLCTFVNHTYTSSGLYNVTLTITNALGCVGKLTKQDYINVTPKPEASFVADPMVTSTSHPTVEFTNTSQDATDFTWNFGDGSPSEFTQDATHTYPDNEGGKYIVTLIASSGPDCKDTARAVIKVDEELIFYVPNSFTPDNDDFNETFKPIFTSGYDPQTYTLSIYDRWGELIFESHNADIGWNGTYGEKSSKIVKQGVYVWKIEVKETGKDKRNTYTGHVNLLK